MKNWFNEETGARNLYCALKVKKYVNNYNSSYQHLLKTGGMELSPNKRYIYFSHDICRL